MEERIIANGLTRREFVKAALAGTAVLAFSSAGIPSTAWAQTNVALRYSAPAIRGRCPCTRHLGKDRRLPLRQAPSRLPLYPERSGEEYALREDESRGDHQGNGRRSGENAHVQQAAQVWNHTFYWNGMKAGGGGKPAGEIGKRIEKDFGSYENFRKEFVGAALGQFGSGWAWLATDGKSLKVVKTPNAENPITPGIDAPADDRRLGARLLPGLPEPSEGFRGGFPRQAGQLGLRGEEPAEVAGRFERKKRRPDGPGKDCTRIPRSLLRGKRA